MQHCDDFPRPSVTTDIVVFTLSVAERAISVLLIERGEEPFKGWWALPGGFLQMQEDLEAGARRELSEETGVSTAQLEGWPFFQLGTFGAPDRDPRDRVITVCYMTFLPAEGVELIASGDASDASWFPLTELPPLAFDHDQILAAARRRLSSLAELAIPRDAVELFRFLGDEFTLSEAQALFETVRGTSWEKRNFRKWINLHWNLKDLNKKTTGGRHRPAALYKIIGLKHPD